MASPFSCFCVGKRWNEITIKSKDIDGGTRKESPSKLKTIIRAEAAANNNSKSDVGSEPFKVKHWQRGSRSLVTDGGGGAKEDCFKIQTFDLKGKGGGGAEEGGKSNDTRSAKDYKKAKTAKKSQYRGSLGELLGDHGETYFATTKPPQPLVVRIKCKRLLHKSHSPDNESSLKNELFKIKTFDLRGGDGGNGVETGGGVGGQGGGAGGVAK